MSGAMQALQSALLTRFRADPALGAIGLYDGPPPRAHYPYLCFSGGQASDWSTKTASGRELRLSFTLWDDGESAARLNDLTEAACACVEALPSDVPGWRIASLVFLRARTLRTAAGPWSSLIEYRVRLLAD